MDHVSSTHSIGCVAKSVGRKKEVSLREVVELCTLS